MIDQAAISTLCAIVDAFVASSREVPIWVTDALIAGAQDPALPSALCRRAELVLREAEQQECSP